MYSNTIQWSSVKFHSPFSNYTNLEMPSNSSRSHLFPYNYFDQIGSRQGEIAFQPSLPNHSVDHGNASVGGNLNEFGSRDGISCFTPTTSNQRGLVSCNNAATAHTNNTDPVIRDEQPASVAKQLEMLVHRSIMTPTDHNKHLLHPALGRVDARLENHLLWSQFHQLGTEMIVTKMGRRMFPNFHIRLEGLIPDAFYALALEFKATDEKRYRYSFQTSTWIQAGRGDPPSNRHIHLHHDGLAKGSHWMRQPILFDKLKLTNNPFDRNNHITQLKIASNPFAKGFRDSGSDNSTEKLRRQKAKHMYENERERKRTRIHPDPSSDRSGGGVEKSEPEVHSSSSHIRVNNFNTNFNANNSHSHCPSSSLSSLLHLHLLTERAHLNGLDTVSSSNDLLQRMVGMHQCDDVARTNIDSPSLMAFAGPGYHASGQSTSNHVTSSNWLDYRW